MKLICGCGKHVSVPEGAAGKAGKCPRCGASIVVPGPPATAAVSPSAPATAAAPASGPATPPASLPETAAPAGGASSAARGVLVLVLLLPVLVAPLLPCVGTAIALAWLLPREPVPPAAPEDLRADFPDLPDEPSAPLRDSRGRSPAAGPARAPGKAPGPARSPSADPVPEPEFPEWPWEPGLRPFEPVPPPRWPPGERGPGPPGGGAAAGTPPPVAPKPGPPAPARPAETKAKTEAEKALEAAWLLRRRRWTLDAFLRFVEAFLEKNRETHDCGLLRFEVAPDASDALAQGVVIQLEHRPLLEAVEQVCRQLRLRYALDRKAGTVRLTRTGEGRAPPPLPPETPSAVSERTWKSPPLPQTASEARQLAVLVFRATEALRNERYFSESEELIRKIGELRTREALHALRTLSGKSRQAEHTTLHVAKAAGVVDGGEAALFLMELAMKRFSDDVQAGIFTALEGLRTKEAAEALGRAGLWHDEKAIRLASAWRLGSLAWERSLEPLKAAAARSKCPETRAEATRAVSRIPGPDAVEALFELAGGADPAVVAPALDGLVERSADRERLLKTARSALDRRRSEEAAILALWVLGREADVESLDRVIRSLRGPEWRVKVAAVRALAEIRHEGGVEPLIEALAGEKERVAAEISEALYRLTGNDFGEDADLWRRWWADHKEGFFPPPMARRARKENLTAAPACYHSIPVFSKRIVFLLDVSISMTAEMSVANPPEGAPADGTQLEFCAWELGRVIDRLASDAWFNIVAFESRAEAWQRTLVPATPANKAEARRFLEALRPTGTTALWQALKDAFEDPAADTLYVLSDGDPDDPPGEILRWVRERNRTKFILIHTIGVGRGSPFLEQLAKENGGRWVEVR
jgi:HEAT repeat protein